LGLKRALIAVPDDSYYGPLQLINIKIFALQRTALKVTERSTEGASASALALAGELTTPLPSVWNRAIWRILVNDRAVEVNLRRKLNGCLQHTADYLVKCQPQDRKIEARIEHQYPLITYARVCNMFRADRLLLTNGINDEALALARSMIEEALRLHHLSTLSERERKSCIAHYVRRGFIEMEQMAKTGVAWWPEKQETLVGVRRKKAEVEQWAGSVQVKGVKPPNDTDLVKKYLRDDLALVWQMSQQMVHGSLFAHTFLLPDGMSSPIVIWADASVNQLRETAALVSFSLAMAHNAMADMYDWPRMPDAETLGPTILEFTSENSTSD
jgi:hypothetical protein